MAGKEWEHVFACFLWGKKLTVSLITASKGVLSAHMVQVVPLQSKGSRVHFSTSALMSFACCVLVTQGREWWITSLIVRAFGGVEM